MDYEELLLQGRLIGSVDSVDTSLIGLIYVLVDHLSHLSGFNSGVELVYEESLLQGRLIDSFDSVDTFLIGLIYVLVDHLSHVNG